MSRDPQIRLVEAGIEIQHLHGPLTKPQALELAAQLFAAADGWQLAKDRRAEPCTAHLDAGVSQIADALPLLAYLLQICMPGGRP